MISEEWRLSEEEMAERVLGELQRAGEINVFRGEAIGTLRKWLDGLGSDLRAGLCAAWRKGRAEGVTPVELAAMIADVIASMTHGIPTSLLSVYIARFVGQRICPPDSEATE